MRRPFSGAPVDWLIVGLGNPGREYEGTRHNIGFEVLTALARQWELPPPKARFRGLIAEGRVPAAAEPEGAPARGGAAEGRAAGRAEGRAGPHQKVALLWPQTYMNEAGRSVGPACGWNRVPLDRLLVIHDEIDLPFGEVRTRLGGGLAGHNGLKSISREAGGVGGTEFWRVRVGVGRPNSTDPEIVASYVLSRFREGREEVEELIERAREAAEEVLAAQAPG